MKGLKTFLIGLLSISGVLLMLWFILPAVYISFTYVPVALCCAAMCFVAFFSDRSNRHRFIYIFLPCLLLAIIYYLVPYNLHFKEALNEFQQIIMFTAPAMLATFLLSFKSDNSNYIKIRKAVTVIFVGCIALVYILTMKELSVNPSVCRALASGDRTEELMALRARNIGGFGFSYSMGVIENYTFFNAITEKEKKKKAIYIILSIALYIFIIRSQYMTLFVLCLVVNILTCLRFVKSSWSRILIVLAALIVLALADPISTFIAKAVTGNVLSEKFYNISGVFEGAGYTSLRINYVRDCLKSFSENMFMGKFNLINIPEAYNISIKSHSTQLKILVDTGLLGFIMYNGYFLYMRHYMVKQIRKNGKNPSPFIMCFWFVWILSWLNPIYQIYELPFALFLVVPLLICFDGSRNTTSAKNKGDDVRDES